VLKRRRKKKLIIEEGFCRDYLMRETPGNLGINEGRMKQGRREKIIIRNPARKNDQGNQ